MGYNRKKVIGVYFVIMNYDFRKRKGVKIN